MTPPRSKYRPRRAHLVHEAIWRLMRTGQLITATAVAQELYGRVHNAQVQRLRPVVRRYADAGLLEVGDRPGQYVVTAQRSFSTAQLSLQDRLAGQRDRAMIKEGALRDRLDGVLPAAEQYNVQPVEVADQWLN